MNKKKIVAIIVLVVAISVVVFSMVNSGNNYAMTDEEFSAYINRPIGAIMADIDYADDEKIVFHYGTGFFITNEKTKEIEHKINLGKMNTVLPVQGDTILTIKIDADGNYAYLSTDGWVDETKKFDKYIVDLNSGKVKKDDMPEETEIFKNYVDIESVAKTEGWKSFRCVKNGDKTYYLNFREGTVGNIELVTIDNKNSDNSEIRYIFGSDIEAPEVSIESVIYSALEDDEEIFLDKGESWIADAEKVKPVIDKFSEILNLNKIELVKEKYKIMLYATEIRGDGCRRLIIIDEDMNLVFTARLTIPMKDYMVEIENLLELSKK